MISPSQGRQLETHTETPNRLLELKQAEKDRIEEIERKEAEKWRLREERMAVERQRVARENMFNKKLEARNAAKRVFTGAVQDAFDELDKAGYFADPVALEVEKLFLPGLLQKAAELVEKKHVASSIMSEIVARAQAKKESRAKALYAAQQRAKRKGFIRIFLSDNTLVVRQRMIRSVINAARLLQPSFTDDENYKNNKNKIDRASRRLGQCRSWPRTTRRQ